jgi:hypothetical protein
MSFANDSMLRTPEPGFLAPVDGNYAAGDYELRFCVP